jgi:large subunit ribosomal protein L21
MEIHMYAIIETGGRQLRVSPDQHVRVGRLDAEVGATVTFDRVFAVRNNGDFLLGSPTVKKAKVTAVVVGHGKSDKVVIYKIKRRKYYRRKRGHRQPYTEVKISEIVV